MKISLMIVVHDHMMLGKSIEHWMAVREGWCDSILMLEIRDFFTEEHSLQNPDDRGGAGLNLLRGERTLTFLFIS